MLKRLPKLVEIERLFPTWHFYIPQAAQLNACCFFQYKVTAPSLYRVHRLHKLHKKKLFANDICIAQTIVKASLLLGITQGLCCLCLIVVVVLLYNSSFMLPYMCDIKTARYQGKEFSISFHTYIRNTKNVLCMTIM